MGKPFQLKNFRGKEASFPRRVGLFACLFLVFFTGPVIGNPKTVEQAITWDVEKGWLVAWEGTTPLFKPGKGFPCDVTIDSSFLLHSATPAVTVSPLGKDGWSVTYEVPRGKLVERIASFPALGVHAWQRCLTYTNLSDATQDLTAAVLRSRPVPCESAKTWSPDTFWMGEAEKHRIVGISYQATTDYYSFSREKALVVTRIRAAWRLKPGEEASIGNGIVWIGNGSSRRFRDEAQRWFRAAGLVIPASRPSWLAGTILYEADAGGHADSRFSDVGGFQAFSHQLDYLADLGITAIWYGSVHTHKAPPDPIRGKWNHYDPLNFQEIDPILGGPAAFKRLVEETHNRGIHVIGEIVPHGGHSVQSKKYPGWWIRNRSGEVIRPWGAPVMDYSSPEWQREMSDSLAMLAREFGVEGVRIDVAMGHGPNWKSPRSHHASFSTLGGSLEMLAAMKRGLSMNSSEPVLIPETGKDWPEFLCRGAVVGYGMKTTQFFTDHHSLLVTDPLAISRALTDFFEDERGSLPKGSLVLRTLNNHDTVIAHGRPQIRFGSGPARALYGVCLCVPGIPMMYQEEEVGSLEILGRMNRARMSVPEMVQGKPDYLSVSYVPEAFLVLRSVQDSHALGIVNLSGKKIRGNVLLPNRPGLAEATQVYDAVRGGQASIMNRAFSWSMEPYETSILRIGHPPLFPSSASKHPIVRSPPQKAPADENGIEKRFTGEKPPVPVSNQPFGVEVERQRVSVRSGNLVALLTAGRGSWFPCGKNEQVPAGYHNESATLALADHGNSVDITVHCARGAGPAPLTLQIYNTDRWYVSARTALLEDRLLRRHFPFPPGSDYFWNRTMFWGKDPSGNLYNHVAPCGRLWQSIVEPLHPRNPGLLFRHKNGSGLVVSRIHTNASNIVLTDRSDESVAEPYGLALRFYASDPDLAPAVRAFGYGQVWKMDSYPQPAREPLFVSFRLSPWGEESESLLGAERLPLRPSYVLETRENGSFFEFFDATYYKEPGRITWKNLASVPDGPYRIVFELRQSEISGDRHELEPFYSVEINGAKTPLEWFESNTNRIHNSYFGLGRTSPVDLGSGPNTISITASHRWCAVRKGFKLVSGTE